MSLNKYSLKKIRELNEQVPVRLELIKRCGGTPIDNYQDVRHNGTHYKIHRVFCYGGYCECDECNGKRWFSYLEPHEKHSRGRGGKLSQENSIMVSRDCHNRLDPRKVKLEWIGD